MVHSKTKVAKLETKAFQFMECLNTGFDIDLFSKTIISIVGDKHHCHPVISGVTRNLFRATAIYNIHNLLFLLSHYFIGQTFGLPSATKKAYGLIGEKIGGDFPSAGLPLCSRPRSIPSRNYKKCLIFNLFLLNFL